MISKRERVKSVKVPLRVGQGRAYEGLLLITTVIKSTALPIMGSVDFVVDTGSSKSFLNLIALRQIGSRVSPKILKFAEEAWMGGGRSLFANIGECRLTFKTAEEKPVAMKTDSFWVAQEMKQYVGMVPSILGTDFFRHHKIKICFDEDPPYLELPD